MIGFVFAIYSDATWGVRNQDWRCGWTFEAYIQGGGHQGGPTHDPQTSPTNSLGTHRLISSWFSAFIPPLVLLTFFFSFPLTCCLLCLMPTGICDIYMSIDICTTDSSFFRYSRKSLIFSYACLKETVCVKPSIGVTSQCTRMWLECFPTFFPRARIFEGPFSFTPNFFFFIENVTIIHDRFLSRASCFHTWWSNYNG